MLQGSHNPLIQFVKETICDFSLDPHQLLQRFSYVNPAIRYTDTDKECHAIYPTQGQAFILMRCSKDIVYS